MKVHQGTGRKDTGRTDRYSDEDPKKDYQDYREDYPASNKAREIAKEISDGKRPPQFIDAERGARFAKAQEELIAHIKARPARFANSVLENLWYNKLYELMEKLKN
jgi:hypothetical protein